VSFDESKGVYHCHGAGCDFSGSCATLARELELIPRLTAEEYRELRKNRARADRASRALYVRVQARRFELLDRLHDLNRRESVAHDAGPTEAAWDTLAVCYRERGPILAELAILEDCGAADVIRFLSADSPTRHNAITAVIERDGLCDSSGRLIKVNA
jgi:hypothetical protein